MNAPPLTDGWRSCDELTVSGGVAVVIDCETCAIRGAGCSDCVITVLLDAPPKLELAEPELRAIDALAGAGLLPRLRLVPLPDSDFAADTPDRPVRSAERSPIAAGRLKQQVS